MNALLNIAGPVVLDQHLLSVDECNHVTGRVLDLRDQWSSNENIKCFKFLPTGMYASDADRYKQQVRAQRDLMLCQFGDVYEKLVDALQRTLGIQIILCDQLHLPGFHISHNPGMPTTNFHCDGFGYLNSIVQQDQWYKHHQQILPASKILSVILPVCLPSTGGGLIYKTNTLEREFKYSCGALAMWPGSLPHSVKPFQIDSETDYRITMQSHLLCFGNTAYLFW